MVAEFVRQSKEKVSGLTPDRVLSDPRTLETIPAESRLAYDTIFSDLKVRVVVAGSDNKRSEWETWYYSLLVQREREVLCWIGYKKASGSNEMFLTPDVLDAVASTHSRSNKSDKRTVTSYDVRLSDLMTYADVSLDLTFTLKKSHINTLGGAESTKIGLKAFVRLRDEEDRQVKLEEERERAREEEDRRRRAARREAERRYDEARREEMRREKAKFEKMKREFRGFNSCDFDAQDEEGCNCSRCQFERMFTSGSGFRRRSGGGFVFTIGGIPIFSMGGDSDSDEDFFGGFDARWEEERLQEKREENRKQAEILGVDPEADERTLKVACRKLALKYHPDKWKSDSEHGMSKIEAENRFKSIQSAYDHLMSNFDDDEDNDGDY